MTDSAQRPELERPILHHVNLKTTRPQEMMEWYELVVGMQPNHVAEVGSWLSNDGANHRLALLAVPGLSDDERKLEHTGMHHLAFEFSSWDDLLRSCERLLGLGVRPHAVLDHGMTLSFYFVDPDGNSVELQADNFGDWADSSHWMRTSAEFAIDPIGTPVDPEPLIAAWRAGAGRDELHRRAYAGEFMPAEPLDLRLP